MPAQVSAVVGREAELQAVTAFLARARSEPAVLVLQGEAGIGKTTIWAAGLDLARARGARVLAARPGQSETGLAFAGLADLIAEALDEVGAALPVPQLRALRIALLLDEADGTPPDERAVGAAVRSALTELARREPALLAIDDVQWLDRASARALSFALRRVSGVPLGVMLTERGPSDADLPLGLRDADVPVERLAIGPLDTSALHGVLAGDRERPLPRAALRRVHEVSEGNPFFALELMRALRAHGEYDLDPLPIPRSLRDLVHNRLLSLPARGDALALVAALAHPTATIIHAVGGQHAGATIEAAVDAGVLHLEGERLRFAHPLLASGAYEELSPLQRRALHRRLAAAVADPVERGHHLARATEAPDSLVAAELDTAITAALQRGALQAAAELGAHARRLTPAADAAAKRRRALGEAECRRLLGESARAREILEEALDDCPRGPGRAALLYELGLVELWGIDWLGAGALLRDALVEIEDGDEALRARAELHLAQVYLLLGDEPRLMAEHAARAAASAEAVGDDAMLAEALALRGRADVQLGVDAAPVIERALALEATTAALTTLNQPSDHLAEVRGWHDDFAAALATLRGVCGDAEERGEETAVAWTLGRIALLLCATGAPDLALDHAERAYAFAAESHQPENEGVLLGVIASIAAHRGDETRAREAAGRALATAKTTGTGRVDRLVREAMGVLELSRGDAAAAHGWLEPLVARTRVALVAEPGAMRFVPDEVEALIGIGRLGSATDLLDWYEGCARGLDRGSALVVSARCRGLLAAASRASDDATALLADALDGMSRVDLPLELARTLLALGAVQRRAQRKREARQTLERAVAAFERVGARLWLQRAREELDRIGGRRGESAELTDAELRVAELVARGLSNREVASALFVSAKTVEFHLRNIFRKLGVRSRTELARRV